MVLTMRQLVKYGIPLFVSACLLTVFFSSCSDDSCKSAVGKDKLSALIGQLQGQCCVYEADAYGKCQKKSKPFVPGLKYRCVGDAAVCLGAMGTKAKAAVPALIQALESGPNNYNTGDGTIPTRNQIMYALGRTGDKRAVKPLIAALHSPRVEDTHIFGYQRPRPLGREAAMYALASLGATEAVPHIIPFLKESDRYLFEAATKALAQIKDPRAIPPLIEALNHPTDASLAADALAEFGPKADAAAPVLLEKLKKSPDTINSGSIADAISKIRGEAAVPRITYYDKQADLHRELSTIFKEYKLGGVFFISGSTQDELYAHTIPTGETLYVRPDRSRANSSLTSGQVWIEKDGKKISYQRFSTFEEMRELIKKMLKTRLQATSGFSINLKKSEIVTSTLYTN